MDLTVSDLLRSKRFWAPVMEHLGYRVANDTPEELAFATDDDAATAVVLHPARATSAGKAHDRYAPGLHHLAFRADSREEVDQLHVLLKRLNGTILDPPIGFREHPIRRRRVSRPEHQRGFRGC